MISSLKHRIFTPVFENRPLDSNPEGSEPETLERFTPSTEQLEVITPKPKAPQSKLGRLARLGLKVALGSTPGLGAYVNGLSMIDGLDSKKPLKALTSTAGVAASAAGTALALTAVVASGAAPAALACLVTGGVLHGISQLAGKDTSRTFGELDEETIRLKRAKNGGHDVSSSLKKVRLERGQRTLSASKAFTVGAVGAGLGLGLSLISLTPLALIPPAISIAVKPMLKKAAK